MAMDDEFCQEAEAKLAETGIKILKGTEVKSIQGDDSVKSVKLADGTEIKADMVILAIGAKPNTELAKKAGLELGYQGAIKTDRRMQSYNDPDVFACGDCAEKHSFFSGKALPAMLASVATSEARIAGSNLYSPTHQNFGTISVFSTFINGRAFTVAGLTERQARECKMNVMIGIAEAPDTHPGGMPNSSITKVKLVFAKGTGILLGGSISGGRPAGEMINVISACIMHQMTANDIYQFQMGTHPALTSSPIMYPIVNAAGMVLSCV
jgi:pyruvate/2-oxoglutarate dehydrogenase complex dihydrolipoamide dehydrogenase (E3) component